MASKGSRWALVVLATAALLLSTALQAGAQTKTVNSKMRLEYLMTFRVDFNGPPVDVGQVPSGHRLIFVVSGGTFEGPKLKGKILPGPADWFLTTSDGMGHMDARCTLQTDDGAYIYMSYKGVQVVTEAAGAKLSKGAPIEYGETYWVAVPVFETGDPHYAWLNNIVAVSEAHLGPNGSWIEYRVFQVLD